MTQTASDATLKASMVGGPAPYRVPRVDERDENRDDDEAHVEDEGDGARRARVTERKTAGERLHAEQFVAADTDWVPPSLQPVGWRAGSDPLNVPYWLRQSKAEPAAASNDYRSVRARFLRGLTSMVGDVIAQYRDDDKGPYPRRTLREIHTVLHGDLASISGQQTPPRPAQMGSLDPQTWRRAQETALAMQEDVEEPMGRGIVA